MPKTAQDRVSRGPFAALLILLSLFLGSATAAGADLRGPSTRLGSGRHNPAAALLPSATRSSLEDEDRASGTGPSLLPSIPGIVTEGLRAPPRAGFPPDARAAAPRPASASYRARAPPAS